MAITDPYFNNPPVPVSKTPVITVPARLMTPGQGMIGIQHTVPAATAVTGVAPDGTAPALVVNGLMKWTTISAAGLFDFGSQDAIVCFLELDVGDAASCTVNVVNLDTNGAVLAGESTRIFKASAAGVIYIPYPIRLTARQAIQVVAASSTTGMVLRVKAVAELMFRG